MYSVIRGPRINCCPGVFREVNRVILFFIKLIDRTHFSLDRAFSDFFVGVSFFTKKEHLVPHYSPQGFLDVISCYEKYKTFDHHRDSNFRHIDLSR